MTLSRAAFAPAGGSEAITALYATPSSNCCCGSLTKKPSASSRAFASSKLNLATSGTSTGGGPRDTTRWTVVPSDTNDPAVGRCETTSPATSSPSTRCTLTTSPFAAAAAIASFSPIPTTFGAETVPPPPPATLATMAPTATSASTRTAATTAGTRRWVPGGLTRRDTAIGGKTAIASWSNTAGVAVSSSVSVTARAAATRVGSGSSTASPSPGNTSG